ncbi:ATP-dependent RNA helicase DbpA [Gammaproteobacteria bacterium]|nr:ATP-dependent RNA helicase DbpA [Gammaproteobacteria bacterium]
MKHVEPNSPAAEQSFSILNLKEDLLNNVASLGYSLMTPIQAQSLPVMLAGQDVIAGAKTGSGKTAAFGLCLLNSLNIKKYAVQALILCPTRELAEQVSQSLRQLARQMVNVKIVNLSGGVSIRPQLDSLRHSAHIVVGTPGRVQKHLDKKTLSLCSLKTLVLDEADRMLDIGFLDAIRVVIAFCPKVRQTLLFSATFPAEIKNLASTFMKNPKKIVIETAHSESDIEQIFYEVAHQKYKLSLLKSILHQQKAVSTLIFCNTKEETRQLANTLNNDGFSVIALNGDMEQSDRDLAMIRFKNQSVSILVATDVAARGLDVKELPLVISFDIAFDHEVHIHRIGRTGRAGCKGLAVGLTVPADAERLCLIEERLKNKINLGDKTNLNKAERTIQSPRMITFRLNVGKKDKIRPGDILGALTKDAGLVGDAIGIINITSLYSYVAIYQEEANKLFQFFKNGKLKNYKVDARILN